MYDVHKTYVVLITDINFLKYIFKKYMYKMYMNDTCHGTTCIL